MRKLKVVFEKTINIKKYLGNFNYVKSNEIKRVVCKGYYNLAELQAAIEDDTEDTVYITINS